MNIGGGPGVVDKISVMIMYYIHPYFKCKHR